MALIKCPECGKEISDKTSSCPNCGYPIKKKITFTHKKIIVPIVIVALAVIVIFIVSFGGNNKLIRNAKWDESLNSVLKREQKNVSGDNIYISDDIICISNISIYGEDRCKLWYKFDENNKLNEIIVRANSYDYYDLPEKVDEQFLDFLSEIEKELGSPTTSNTDGIVKKVTWSFKGVFITLEYSFSYEHIELTYIKQK